MTDPQKVTALADFVERLEHLLCDVGPSATGARWEQSVRLSCTRPRRRLATA